MNWKLTLQIFKSFQTGIIDLVEAKVSPRQFQNLMLSHQTQELAFLFCLFVTATTFFTASTFYWLTFCYGHGDCCHCGYTLHSHNLELKCWVWNQLPFYPSLSPCDSREFIEYCCYSFTIDFASLPLHIIMLLFMQLELWSCKHEH